MFPFFTELTEFYTHAECGLGDTHGQNLYKSYIFFVQYIYEIKCSWYIVETRPALLILKLRQFGGNLENRPILLCPCHQLLSTHTRGLLTCWKLNIAILSHLVWKLKVFATLEIRVLGLHLPQCTWGQQNKVVFPVIAHDLDFSSGGQSWLQLWKKKVLLTNKRFPRTCLFGVWKIRRYVEEELHKSVMFLFILTALQILC